MSTSAKHKRNSRIRRHTRVRKKVRGTATRPRLAVFRSNKHITAQVIDDVLMFLAPEQNRRDDYLTMLERLDEVMLCLEPHLPPGPGDDVANDSAK